MDLQPNAHSVQGPKMGLRCNVTDLRAGVFVFVLFFHFLGIQT